MVSGCYQSQSGFATNFTISGLAQSWILSPQPHCPSHGQEERGRRNCWGQWTMAFMEGTRFKFRLWRHSELKNKATLQAFSRTLIHSINRSIIKHVSVLTLLFLKGTFTAVNVPNILGDYSYSKYSLYLKWELFFQCLDSHFRGELSISVLPLNIKTLGCGFIYFTFHPYEPSSLHHSRWCSSISVREGSPIDRPQPPELWMLFVLISFFFTHTKLTKAKTQQRETKRNK